MGAEESFCSSPVEQLEIPTSVESGLEANLKVKILQQKIFKKHLPSRNYARKSSQRPNLSERVQ